jgi:SAM-dependent methyltransferase
MDVKGISWEQAVQTLRDDPAQKELVLACFYDDPVEQAAARYQQTAEWAALEKLLPQGAGRVLDLGSGRGIVAHALSKSGWTVTAAEPDPSPIVGGEAIRRLSRATGTPIEVIECYGEAIACESESFELVHCRAVLHHAQDLNRLCGEVARVLRPGGKFIATREPVLTREADRDRFLHDHPLHKLFGGENAYRLGTYTSAIRGAGLVIERVYNPLETDINTFPTTVNEAKLRIAHRLMLPSHRWVPDLALRLLGSLSDAPGRLYTFVASKMA